MARVGGHRGRSSGHTYSHDGSARDVRLFGGKPAAQGKNAGQISPRIMDAMGEYYAAVARGDRATADKVMADFKAGKPVEAAAGGDAGKSAAPMNSPEDRYVNRMRAGDSTKTDAELRQQYRDKASGKAAKAAPKKSGAAAVMGQVAKGQKAKEVGPAVDNRGRRERRPTRSEQAKINAVKSEARKTSRSPESAARALAEKTGRPWSDMGGYERQSFIDEAAKQQAKPAKKITAKRQAAIDAYKEAYGGREPPKRMSIKAINEQIANDKARWAWQEKMMAPLRDGEDAVKAIADKRAAAKSASGRQARRGAIQQNADVINKMGEIAGRSSQKNAAVLAERFGPVAPPKQAMRSARATYGKAMTGLGIAGLAWQAMGAYNRARDPEGLDGNKTRMEAYKDAGEAILPGAALAALSTVSKVAGRAILPVMTAYSAFQGAREDKGSWARGAVRGAVRALDPTQLFMDRGYGEQAVDALLGAAPKPKEPSMWERMTAPFTSGSAAAMPGQGPQRLSAGQQQQFDKANAGYRMDTPPAPQANPSRKGEKGARGFANPHVQKAAQEARGVQNITDWAQSGDNYPGGA